MDIEALRFGVAILSGGLVAVFSAVLTFRYAQRLERQRQEREAAGLRRALVNEIRENIQRLGDEGRGWAMPADPLIRVAWDRAHTLDLPARTFRAIAAGYEAGTYAHEVTTLAFLMLNRPWGFFEKLTVVKRVAATHTKLAQSQSQVARECFVIGLKELGEPMETTSHE